MNLNEGSDGRSQQRYLRIARTNALFDLLVWRENGPFLNTDTVAQLFRGDNLQYGGWSTVAVSTALGSSSPERLSRQAPYAGAHYPHSDIGGSFCGVV